MSTAIIVWTPQSLGVHQIGVRDYTDSVNTYSVSEVNVVSLTPQTLEINVEGNLYCAHEGILYTGYIIPLCAITGDVNGDGIPDGATEFSILAEQQIDPAQVNTYECIALPIYIVDINCVPAVNCPTTCTGGTYDVTVVPVTPGDEIEPAVIQVSISVTNDISVNIIDGGLYKAAPTLDTSSVPGCPGAIDLTAHIAGKSDNLDLTNYTYSASLNDGEDPIYSFLLNGRFKLIPSLINTLPVNFKLVSGSSEKAHCKSCKTGSVDASAATTGIGKLSYYTCWDGSNNKGSLTLVTIKVAAGNVISIPNALDNVYYIDEGTLDVSPVITY